MPGLSGSRLSDHVPVTTAAGTLSGPPAYWQIGLMAPELMGTQPPACLSGYYMMVTLTVKKFNGSLNCLTVTA